MWSILGEDGKGQAALADKNQPHAAVPVAVDDLALAKAGLPHGAVQQVLLLRRHVIIKNNISVHGCGPPWETRSIF